MSEAPSLYAGLCPAWHNVDRTVRRFHENPVATRVNGRFDVVEGGWCARVLARIVGLPRAGEDIPSSVEITPEHGGEIWRRRFGEVPFVSEQHADRGLLTERVGITLFRFLLCVDSDGGLYFKQIDAALCLGSWRLRLPRWLAPHVSARAWRAPEGERWMRVEVEVRLPLIGRLFGYQGRLELALDAA